MDSSVCYLLPHRTIDVIESTTSALVIITTIVFGGVTSVVQNALLSSPKTENSVKMLKEDEN